MGEVATTKVEVYIHPGRRAGVYKEEEYGYESFHGGVVDALIKI